MKITLAEFVAQATVNHFDKVAAYRQRAAAAQRVGRALGEHLYNVQKEAASPILANVGRRVSKSLGLGTNWKLRSNTGIGLSRDNSRVFKSQAASPHLSTTAGATGIANPLRAGVGAPIPAPPIIPPRQLGSLQGTASLKAPPPAPPVGQGAYRAANPPTGLTPSPVPAITPPAQVSVPPPKPMGATTAVREGLITPAELAAAQQKGRDQGARQAGYASSASSPQSVADAQRMSKAPKRRSALGTAAVIGSLGLPMFGGAALLGAQALTQKPAGSYQFGGGAPSPWMMPQQM